MWISDKAHVQIRMVQYEAKACRRRLRRRCHRLLREPFGLIQFCKDNNQFPMYIF